jgi:LysM repeat protein
MRKPIRSIWATIVVLLALILVAGCTRDRSKPEETPETSQPTIVEPAVTMVSTKTGEKPSPTPEPTATPTPTPETKTIAYTVQPGDTLSTIAEKFDTDTQTLRELNFLTEDAILVGQIIRVPLKEGVTPEGVPTPTPEPFRYIVQPGDTLYSIAISLGVAADEIIAANTLADPNNLVVGTELIIPGYQAPAQAGETAPSSQPYVHVVQPGESLSQIAEQYGVSSTDIMDANGITDPNLIAAGQELIIPGYQPPSNQAESSAPVIHKVQVGETLSQIAQRYGVLMSAIMEANNINNPNLIRPGQELVIPGITQADAEAAGKVTHVVKPGESLLEIARQYGVSAQAIIDANHIQNPDLIKPGQELIIPSE